MDKIGVSACLLGVNCKYNGGNNYNEKLAKYIEDKEVILICPEVLGGLSIPRSCCEIVGGVVISKDGENVDEQFKKGARIALEKLKSENCKVCILQSRSPSCGVKQIYDGSFSGKLINGSGLFAKLAKQSGIEVIDVEDFLKNKV